MTRAPWLPPSRWQRLKRLVLRWLAVLIPVLAGAATILELVRYG